MKDSKGLKKIGITPKQISYLLAANVLYALALDLFYVHHYYHIAFGYNAVFFHSGLFLIFAVGYG
jgi:hypothetical protein